MCGGGEGRGVYRAEGRIKVGGWGGVREGRVPGGRQDQGGALYIFCIPLQTAVVERGFNVHRLIKTRLSNRLLVATIDSLLRVKLLATKT